MKLVITGGHHTSAIPIIEKLRKGNLATEIFWVGHKRSQLGNKSNTLEYDEIRNLGIPFFDLKAGKFYKTYNVERILRIPFGFFQAFYYLLRVKPDVILSFGGYLAVPVVISGWFLGIPAVTHEQTVVVGYANKLISRFAKKVLISWPDSGRYFKPEKVVFTGLPLRKAIFEVRSNSFKVNNSLPTIYVTAGKTGSHFINLLIKESLDELLEFSNIIHQCGSHSEYDDSRELLDYYDKIKAKSKGNYFSREFILENEIGEAFGRSCMVISRSGAHTIFELLALKKPALLIPIPNTSHNEQLENARLIQKCGLAEVLEQKGCKKDVFISKVEKIIDNIDKYKPDGSLQNLSFENSADLIIQEVKNLV